MILCVKVDPPSHLRGPQLDAVMLEQGRHRRVLSAVEGPLVLADHDRIPAAVCPATAIPGKAVASILNHLRALRANKDDQVTASRKTVADVTKQEKSYVTRLWRRWRVRRQVKLRSFSPPSRVC